MNILFTSVGRRVELVRAFSAAARREKKALTIWGADLCADAPALFFCDRKALVPPIKSAEYIPALLSLCQKEKIDALIPTIDTDLFLLASHRSAFEEIGTKVLVSAPEKVALCRDKRKTAAYFQSVGLLSPVPVDDVARYDGPFPAFIKPKDGSSSIFAYRADTQEELLSYARQVPDYIIQPFIRGTEYTVDIFCDLRGNPVYITPRVRLSVRAGEVLKTRISQDEKIISEMQTLLSDYRPTGAITVQLIREETSGDDYYIEINPRFGGGAPLSMAAGADSAAALLHVLCGEEVPYQPHAAQDGAVYSRFDQSVRVK